MKLWGMDYLGAGNNKTYRANILKYHPTGWAAGFFDEEFGDVTETVKALIKTGKCPIIRIQLFWAGKLHNYNDSYIPKLILKSQKWEKIQKENPSVRIWLSDFCEHKLSNPDKYLNIVQQYAPSCGKINSPLRSGALSKHYWNEFHGAETKPRKSSSPILFSFDGTNAVDSDVTTYKENYRNAEVFFLWIPQFNQHKSMKPEDGAKRDCVPTKEQIESLAYLATDKGNTQCPEDSIYKSHSDQHNSKPEPRAGKPVLITADKGEKIYGKAGNKIVATFNRGEIFREVRPGKPKRYIYRCSEYGYKISQTAAKLTGSPVLQIIANNKFIGRLNLAFRDGTYR